MAEAEGALRPGIEEMLGLLAYYAGADPATNSLTNASIRSSFAHAQQIENFSAHAGVSEAFPSSEATPRAAKRIASYRRQLASPQTNAASLSALKLAIAPRAANASLSTASKAATMESNAATRD